MTCDREQQVIIPRRQPRQLVLEKIWHFFRSGALPSNFSLGLFGKYIRRQVSQPSFEHRTDNVDIIQIMLLE